MKHLFLSALTAVLCAASTPAISQSPYVQYGENLRINTHDMNVAWRELSALIIPIKDTKTHIDQFDSVEFLDNADGARFHAQLSAGQEVFTGLVSNVTSQPTFKSCNGSTCQLYLSLPISMLRSTESLSITVIVYGTDGSPIRKIDVIIPQLSANHDMLISDILKTHNESGKLTLTNNLPGEQPLLVESISKVNGHSEKVSFYISKGEEATWTPSKESTKTTVRVQTKVSGFETYNASVVVYDAKDPFMLSPEQRFRPILTKGLLTNERSGPL